MQITEVSQSAPSPAIHIPLDAGLTLLRKAASDDGFRHDLETRPAEALASLGFDVAVGNLPREIDLPSESALRELIEQQAFSIIRPPPDSTQVPWACYPA